VLKCERCSKVRADPFDPSFVKIKKKEIRSSSLRHIFFRPMVLIASYHVRRRRRPFCRKQSDSADAGDVSEKHIVMLMVRPGSATIKKGW
jgi:hypothetical protein